MAIVQMKYDLQCGLNYNHEQHEKHKKNDY